MANPMPATANSIAHITVVTCLIFDRINNYNSLFRILSNNEPALLLKFAKNPLLDSTRFFLL